MFGDLENLPKALITFGIIVALTIWGLYELYDYFFIFDGIKSPTPITPEIELITKDGVVDTLYIYKLK